MQTAYLVVQGSKFLVPAILKTSNHNYCINRSLKKGLFVNEYYNSLPAFEIIQALVGKRDYFWLCVILLLTSECSELLLQNIHTRGHSPNWGSMNAFIRDLRHSRFKNLHNLQSTQSFLPAFLHFIRIYSSNFMSLSTMTPRRFCSLLSHI